MLCEKCNQNLATSVLTKTINGSSTTTHICAECAFKYGYSNLFGNFSLNHFANEEQPIPKPQEKTKRCEKCNSSFDEILVKGKIGCSECYAYFKSELTPTIENIHGKAYHVGKKPNRYNEINNPVDLMEELKQRLDEAIKTQEFETAAVIRDEIKKIDKIN